MKKLDSVLVADAEVLYSLARTLSEGVRDAGGDPDMDLALLSKNKLLAHEIGGMVAKSALLELNFSFMPSEPTNLKKVLSGVGPSALWEQDKLPRQSIKKKFVNFYTETMGPFTSSFRLFELKRDFCAEDLGSMLETHGWRWAGDVELLACIEAIRKFFLTRARKNPTLRVYSELMHGEGHVYECRHDPQDREIKITGDIVFDFAKDSIIPAGSCALIGKKSGDESGPSDNVLAQEIRNRFSDPKIEYLGPNYWRVWINGWHIHCYLGTQQFVADGTTPNKALKAALEMANKGFASKGDHCVRGCPEYIDYLD